MYLIPGLTKKERDIVLPVSLGSGLLFLFGFSFFLFFSCSCCFKFFISYGSEVVEPFWSFDQYFDFIAVLLFATGLAFQVPAVQVVLGLLGIVSGKTNAICLEICSCYMYCCRSYYYSINRPSNTNIISTALLSLYLGGSGVCYFIKKKLQ